MDLKAAFLATATGTLLLLAGCGGGGGGDGGSSPASQPQQSPPASEPQQSPPTSQPQQLPPAACQPQTIVGGDLAVAEQAPVGMTLLSTGGLALAPYTLTFLYDNVFGIPTVNRQDKWDQVDVFPPGTPVGASTRVQLQPPPPDLIPGQQVPSTFPKGIPVELTLRIHDGNQPGPANISATASIGKDFPFPKGRTARVTYGPNNTATVTFFPAADGTGFTISLTNVTGSGSPTTGAGSGC